MPETQTQTDFQSAFILIDFKLNAILGVFSSLEKTLDAKKAAIKRDLNIIKKDITNKITLKTLNEEERLKFTGILTQIDFIKNDFDHRYDRIVLDYDNYTYTNRYSWYRMPFDVFNIDKSIYGPIVLLPTVSASNLN